MCWIGHLEIVHSTANTSLIRFFSLSLSLSGLLSKTSCFAPVSSGKLQLPPQHTLRFLAERTAKAERPSSQWGACLGSFQLDRQCCLWGKRTAHIFYVLNLLVLNFLSKATCSQVKSLQSMQLFSQYLISYETCFALYITSSYIQQ